MSVLPHLPDSPPDVITRRARVYMLAVAVQYVALIAVLPAWTLAFCAVGWLSATAAFWPTPTRPRQLTPEVVARVALTASVAAELACCGSLIGTRPAAVVMFAACAARDLVVCRQPFRLPFERLVQEVAPDITD